MLNFSTKWVSLQKAHTAFHQLKSYAIYQVSTKIERGDAVD
jgi:hypothetical protein